MGIISDGTNIFDVEIVNILKYRQLLFQASGLTHCLRVLIIFDKLSSIEKGNYDF